MNFDGYFLLNSRRLRDWTWRKEETYNDLYVATIMTLQVTAQIFELIARSMDSWLCRSTNKCNVWRTNFRML